MAVQTRNFFWLFFRPDKKQFCSLRKRHFAEVLKKSSRKEYRDVNGVGLFDGPDGISKRGMCYLRRYGKYAIEEDLFHGLGGIGFCGNLFGLW